MITGIRHKVVLREYTCTCLRTPFRYTFVIVVCCGSLFTFYCQKLGFFVSQCIIHFMCICDPEEDLAGSILCCAFFFGHVGHLICNIFLGVIWPKMAWMMYSDRHIFFFAAVSCSVWCTCNYPQRATSTSIFKAKSNPRSLPIFCICGSQVCRDTTHHSPSWMSQGIPLHHGELSGSFAWLRGKVLRPERHHTQVLADLSVGGLFFSLFWGNGMSIREE